MMPTPEVPSLPAASCDGGDLGVGGLLGLGARPDRRDLGGTTDSSRQGSDHRFRSSRSVGGGAHRTDPESAAAQAKRNLAPESCALRSGYCSEEVSRIRLSKTFSRRGRLSHSESTTCLLLAR